MMIENLDGEFVRVTKDVRFGVETITLNYYQVQQILTFMEKENMG